MKLEADNETLAENKVLILYLLSIIDKPINNTDLYKIVLSIQDVNYFYFQQFLLDLEENDYIIKYTKENSELYELTENGKNTLDLTLDMLPGIIKLKVDTNIKGELKEIKDESAENNTTTFEIKTLATSRDQAVDIVENWNQNAGKIYLDVTKMLNGKKEEKGE